MGRAELLILAGAIVVFEIFTLTMINSELNIKLTNVEEKLDNYAISEAKRYLERMEAFAFDEKINSDNTTPPGFSMPADLTHPDSLGSDGILHDLGPDDIDDFVTINELRKVTIDSVMYFEYQLTCNVYYVDHDSLKFTSSRTTKKRADIIIQNQYLNHNVEFSRIFTYY